MAEEPFGTPARALMLRAHLGGARHADSLSPMYFALLDGHPYDFAVEPTFGVGGYGRATVNNTAALWGTPTLSTLQVTNLEDIIWPNSSAAWSTAATPLTHWAVYASATGAVLWYVGKLATPRIVDVAGIQPRLLAGSLNIMV